MFRYRPLCIAVVPVAAAVLFASPRALADSPPPSSVTPPTTLPPPFATPMAPPIYAYTPRPAYENANEFGIQLHLSGGLVGAARRGTSTIGGVGVGFRYKPIPYFGAEAEVNFSGGADSDGDSRSEISAGLNAIATLNPRARAQLYFVFGIDYIDVNVRGGDFVGKTNLKYVSGSFGPGFEFRVNKGFSIVSDFRASVRSRIDGADVDYSRQLTHNAPTNVSGGVALRAGVVFYF